MAAVAGLGGPEKAQPRTIQQAMRVEGLTLFHVKSHLQKYRRSLRTDGDALDASGEPRKRPVRRRAHYWRHPAQQQPPAGGGAEAVPAAALWGKECAPGGRSAEPVGRGAAALGAGLEQWLGEAADGGAGYDALAALQAGSAQLALQKRLEAHVEVPLSALLPRSLLYGFQPGGRSHSRPGAERQAYRWHSVSASCDTTEQPRS